MRGEIIAIGDELTTGVRLDTNSQWVAQQLGDLGVDVLFHTAVGDELAPMVQVLRMAAQRADVVVCTGGLGPTADDLTREALAACAGVSLVQNDEALAHIRSLYARRKRPMPERNIVQAMFPIGSRVIDNPHGTAPGIDLDLPKEPGGVSRFFALPGVPAEMKEMFSATVAPAILEMIPPAQRRVIRHRRLKCFGVGESDLEAMLPDLIARDRYPRVGITVSTATITLRVTAQEADEQACLAAMQPTLTTMRQLLGELVFGEEDDELQHVIARMLAAKHRTLATAEHYTGGLLAGWMAGTAEAEIIRRGSRLLTSDRCRTKEDVARLAAELREESAADFALVIGALDNASTERENGHIHIALASDGKVDCHSAQDIGHPDIRQASVAKVALDMLRKHLLRAELDVASVQSDGLPPVSASQ